MTATLDSIRANLLGLRMPRALEALEHRFETFSKQFE